MARDRRTPRSSPEPVERQSRRRRVSSPGAWDNTLHLNISHAPTVIYNAPRRALRNTSVFSPTRRESPSTSRPVSGWTNQAGNPLGNPRRGNQPRSARALTSPPSRRRDSSRGRVGRSNTPDWRAPDTGAPNWRAPDLLAGHNRVSRAVTGANCYPLGPDYRPVRTTRPESAPAPARPPARIAARQEPRQVTRSGRFPSSEVCRGTDSGCSCWVCFQGSPASRTPPPAYTTSGQGAGPARSGLVSWWDHYPRQREEIPFLEEGSGASDTEIWVKNSREDNLPTGEIRGYLEENLGILPREAPPPLAPRPILARRAVPSLAARVLPVREEIPPLAPRTPPRADQVVRGQEEYRVSSPGLIVTLSSDSESSRGIGSRTSTPRGSPAYTPPPHRSNSFFVTAPQAEAPGPSSVTQVVQSAGSATRPSLLLPKEVRLNPTASVFRPFGISNPTILNPPATAFVEPEKNKTPSLELSALAALNDAVAAWIPAANHVVPIATTAERRFVPISPIATTPSAGPVRRPEPRHPALRSEPAPDVPLQPVPAAVVEISVVPVAGAEAAPPVPVAQAPTVPPRAVRLGDVTASGNVRPIVARFNYPVTSRFTEAKTVGRIKKVQSFECECTNEPTRCICQSATYRCELTFEINLRAQQ